MRTPRGGREVEPSQIGTDMSAASTTPPLKRTPLFDSHVALGAKLVMIAAVFQLFDGVQGVASGALRGAGDVRFAFLSNLVAYWVIGLPIALWLAFGVGMGAPGLWWGLTLGLVIVAFVLVARFIFLTRGKIERVEKRASPPLGE